MSVVLPKIGSTTDENREGTRKRAQRRLKSLCVFCIMLFAKFPPSGGREKTEAFSDDVKFAFPKI